MPPLFPEQNPLETSSVACGPLICERTVGFSVFFFVRTVHLQEHFPLYSLAPESSQILAQVHHLLTSGLHYTVFRLRFYYLVLTQSTPN